jgi:hypothetical protein
MIENTCIQNVRKGLSHYVDENSGGCAALAIMLLKNRVLIEHWASAGAPIDLPA